MATPCHFALFGLQPAFELDQAELARRYRQQARQVHPDRFAAADERQQRLAIEQTANLNAAYQTLRSASARARYLLGLSGPAPELETTVQDPGFLLQQMHWREELETLQDRADTRGIAPFKARLKQVDQDLQAEFSACWQDPERRSEAERLMRRMQFLDKLAHELRELEEHLDD